MCDIYTYYVWYKMYDMCDMLGHIIGLKAELETSDGISYNL